MGSGSSQDNSTVSFNSFFNSDDKPYFVIYPEEQIINQNFEISQEDDNFFKKKENYLVTARTIIEIFLNYSIITQEKSQFDVLKKIIIPLFSQYLLTDDQKIINSILLFKHCKSVSLLFIEKHNQFLSNFFPPENPKIDLPLLNTNDMLIQTPQIFSKLVNSLTNSQNKFIFSFQSSTSKSDNIFMFQEKEPTNTKLLVNSFIWSLHTCNLDLLLKTFQKLFLFEISEKDKQSQSKKHSFYDNLPKFTVHQNFVQFNISLSHENFNGYINCTDFPFNLPNNKCRHCSIASTPFYLFSYNHSKEKSQRELIKVRIIHNNVSDNSKRFTHFPSLNFFNSEYGIVCSDNVIVFLDQNHNVMLRNSDPDYAIEKVKIEPKRSPQMELPFTSDGHFIYSILSSKEIGVYSLDAEKGILNFVRKISIKESKNNLERPFKDRILSSKLVEGAMLITNGIILQLIYPEQLENNQFSHFVRVVSLIKGKHIRDFRFILPYKLESVCFEPFSRSIWGLSIHSEGFCFIKYSYNGPDPLWMSKVDVIEKPLSTKYVTSCSRFNHFAIEYVYSLFMQFYGIPCRSNDLMLSFFVKSASNENFEFIVSLFSFRSKDEQFVKFLFLILSFQLRFIQLTKEQINSLYELLRHFIVNENIFCFLVIFIVNLFDFLDIQYISKFFDLIFTNPLLTKNDLFTIYCILSRIDHSKKFPYIFENEKMNLVTKLSKNSISNVEIELLISYQASLFRNYSQTIQSNSQNISKIEEEALVYSSLMFQSITLLIPTINSISNFENSLFVFMFRKLIILLKLTVISPSFPRELLKLLLPLLKVCIQHDKLSLNELNPFFLFFFDIFFLYAQLFKQILTFTDHELFDKYEQFLDIKIEEEKTVSDVFKNQINDDELTQIIDVLYSKVSNPMNKRLSNEDKKIEKLIFLAIVYQSESTEEFIEIKGKIQSKSEIKISSELRQIIQSVYRIRSNLRSKKQKEDQTGYHLSYKNIEEKCHFLLQYTSEKSQIKDISNFINNSIQISEIVLAQNRLKDVQINLSMFIQMIDYVFMKSFPNSCLYSFLMYLSENSDILDSFELLIKHVKIDAKKVMLFVQNVLEYFSKMPPNAFLSFICIILIMVAKSADPQQTQRIITDSLSVLFGRLVLRSKDLPKTIFKSSVTFLCYFYRIICDAKLLIKDSNEVTVISTILQETSLKNSLSFTLAHAIMHGGFVPDIIPNIMNIIGMVGEPKFHGLTLLLYEHLLVDVRVDQEEFIKDLQSIMNMIGSVFCGSTNEKILNIAVPIGRLNDAINNAFCRTPTSQQACALELVQLVRRLMLVKDFEISSIINDYFKSLTKTVQLSDQNYMKQLYAMLVIMSNIISIKRPNTIINTNENKSYFALSLNERTNEFIGILLPINNQQLVLHKLDNSSNNIRTTEMIPYNLSLFNNIDIPYSIFELASSTQMKVYSDCLFSFFALECVKENILDTEHGSDFSNTFYSRMKIHGINKFIFKTSVPLILSLLKKSLITPTKGIFVGSPVRPVLFHTSINQLVFDDDYLLTPKIMEARFCPHIFISSILDDTNASYFSIQIGNAAEMCHIFGVVTHSVDQNHLVSITYSAKERAFCINGKKARQFDLQNDIILECRFLPSKNKVAFATSTNRHRVFSCVLPEKSRCSFIALMKRNSVCNYICTMKAQTDCFQKNIHFGQNPIKMLKRFGNKLFKTEIDETQTKFSMLTLDDKEEDTMDIVKYSRDILEQGRTTKEIISTPNIRTRNSYPVFKDLRETDILLTEYPNYSIVPLNRSVYSSPQKLADYYRVCDVSGRFDLIPSSNVQLQQSNFVPPFHFENFYHLPIEIINCYFSGVCELHRSEILTLYFSRIITNSNDVFASLNYFSITTSMIIYFVTNVLLLLEPIKITNLAENKSPIDFESFNGLETCARIDMFDYFTCLTKIIHSFEQTKRYEFIKAWFEKLDKNFHNKYMHFATSQNSSLITMNTSIVGKTQTFSQDDANGWIIFPMQFGLIRMPAIYSRHLIYPKTFYDNSTYAYCKGKSLTIGINPGDDNAITGITYGILPFCQESNESLFYSFYQLAVSFKYFVLFSYKDLNESQRLNLMSFLFDSIVAGSPFFYSHCDEIFSFLKNKITLSFTPDYISRLNIFIASVYKLQNESINHFIDEQISLFDDSKASVFKYFVSDSEKVPSKISLPHPVIPHSINSTTFNPSTFLVLMSRVLLNKSRNEEFPFHLILNEWSYSFSLFPQCELSFIESNVLQIIFTAFVPSSFRLVDQDYNGNEIVYVSFTNDFTNDYTQATMKSIETSVKKAPAKLVDPKNLTKIFVMFPNQETASQRNFIVVSNGLADSDYLPQLAYECRSLFKKDMFEFSNSFTVDDDQHILMKIDINRFNENRISTRLWPGIISTLDTRVHKPYMLFLRGIYLIALNFICLKHPSLMTKTSFSQFRPFISVLFSMNRFLQMIDDHSKETFVKLHIDRQAGLDVRNGLTKNINRSMIGQFTRYYIQSKQDFMNKVKPFYVVFKNENGIDAGGLRRELASELIKDINEEKIGLFIKTPNGRNHEGKYQECKIPSPDPAISSSWRFYEAIGALISIGIRTRIQQPDLLFPPLFWNFLITGNLTIEDIYDIDKSYKNLVTNIFLDAKKMSDDEFERQYSSISFLNSRGNQIKVGSLSSLFSSRKIKKDNCQRIIAECNEARLSELRIPLESIRTGFWENMNFQQPLFVTPNLIELLACGDRIISSEKLKSSLSFDWNVPMQQRRFIKEVIDRMTNDQRRKLIQFSTGISTLSENKINVDYLDYPVDQRLPSSSTCFFRLHLPPFSSAEKMYNALDIAINETGTFENS